MKIRLLSDVHLEFGDLVIPTKNTDPNTTLVLAGDIGVGFGSDFIEWINNCSTQFKHVVMVLGNHEFYNHEINTVRREWKKISKSIMNFHLLDDNVVVLDGVRFVGGTLWTDMNRGDFHTKRMAQQEMNDYFKIRTEVDDIYSEDFYGYHRPLVPDDTIHMHENTVKFIVDQLEQKFDGPTVIVTHHLPLYQCIHVKYKNEMLMNGAYASNLEPIFWKYDFDLWFHGHTHESVLIEDVYGKNIVCNPRGYMGYSLNENFNPQLEINLVC